MEQVINNEKSESEEVFEENGKDHSEVVENISMTNNKADENGVPGNSEESETKKDNPNDGTAEDKPLTTAEASTINLKEILGVGKAKKLTYTIADLMKLSGNATSKERPTCLLKEFDGSNGRWDPETWIRLTSPTPTSSNGSAGDFNLKQNSSKDDKYQGDGLTLRPQRSFRDGCHVSNSTASGTRSLKSASFNDGQITAANRTVRSRAGMRSRSELSESESIKSSEDFEWERDGSRRADRFNKDVGGFRSDRGGRRDFDNDYRENDRDFRDRPYQSTRNNFLARRSESYANHGSSSHGSRNNRMRSFSEHEEEPEWFSEGPTSQFDTIELGGFDDDKGDLSWVGKEIPTDDLDLKSSKKAGSKNATDKHDKSPIADAKPEIIKESPEEEKEAESNFNNFNNNQSVKESNEASPDLPQDTSSNGDKASTSRFSQWFHKQNADSGDSTPHEELEKLAELTAESGMEENHEKVLNQLGLNALPNQLQDDDEHKAHLLMLQHHALANRKKHSYQQEKPGSPSMNEYNSEALQKLVATIREKDKIKKEAEMLLVSQQQGLPNNQIDSIYSQLMQGNITQEEAIYRIGALDPSGQRIPSPEQLVAHTQNIYQKALLKKQLEKQKDVYKDKLRLMEQHRREEQLREAIRSVNEKMNESKQYQKNMAFTPTSVIRKMHESRSEKNDMFPPQQNTLMNSSTSESIESATASLAAKLANITKKTTPQRPEAPSSSSNADSELLARIYQSAAMAKQGGGSKPTQEQWNAMTQRHNDAGPDMQRPNSFNQPLNSSNKNFADASFQGKDKRNLLNVKHPVNYHQHMQNLFAPHSQQQINNAADFYNNNIKQMDGEQQQDASELRHQEVAQLTANVLNEAGISEEKLSSLTVEQQQQVIKIVQQRYHQLQRQKQIMFLNKKDKERENIAKNHSDDFGKKDSSGTESIADERKNFSDQHRDKTADVKAGIRSQINASGVMNSNARTHQQIPHPLHNASLIPPPLGGMPNMFTTIPRGGTVVPTFIPPPHHPLVPPPNAVPLGGPHPAALLRAQQIYAQQAAVHHQQRLLAAALQQQQQQQQMQALHAQMLARKHSQSKTGDDGANFSNPLERWFGPEVLTQSQVPQMQKHPLMLSEIERMRPNAD